jgi:Fic family protein
LEDLFKKIDLYKTLLDKERPLIGNNLQRIKNYYRIGLTYSSNALEGNSMTISETKVVLEDGITIGGKPLKDFYETIGHSNAYDYMFSLKNSEKIEEKDIKQLHKLFYKQIDEANAGEYRKENNFITGSQFETTEYKLIDSEMRELALWIKKGRNNFHPVKFAALLHKKIVFIHPFDDGNGRTARLLMNLALIQKGYEIAIIPPILQSEYIELLEKSHTIDKPFIKFIAERIIETQKDMLRLFHINY